MTPKNENMAEKIGNKLNKIRVEREIKYGEVFSAELDDVEGYEQQGPRPVVVVSYNKQI